MTSSVFLQTLLLVNVFIMGIVIASAIRHAYAHFRPEHHEVEKAHLSAQVVHIPPAVKQRLLETSQHNFESILERSAETLQRELQATTMRLNGNLEKLGSTIIDDEMERYRKSLDQLRQQAEATIAGAQADISEHQAELKVKLTQRQAELEAQMAENIAAQQQALIQNIDTKLSDAVASFLTETLQHNVDLGAQTSYLIATLDEHKEELIKGVSNEA